MQGKSEGGRTVAPVKVEDLDLVVGVNQKTQKPKNQKTKNQLLETTQTRTLV